MAGVASFSPNQAVKSAQLNKVDSFFLSLPYRPESLQGPLVHTYLVPT